jgi:hypothetical protein
MRRDIEAKRRQRDLKEQEEQGLRLIEAEFRMKRKILGATYAVLFSEL